MLCTAAPKRPSAAELRNVPWQMKKEESIMWKTEQRDPATRHIDTAPTAEMVALLQRANE